MDRWTSCPCSCHGMGSVFATCDYDGGCGHLHQPEVDADDPHARRCARKGDCPGYQRVESTNDDGNPCTIRIGAPLEQDRGLCRICRDSLGPRIDELHSDYFKLYAALGADEAATAEGDLVTGSRELPIPIRASVRDLAARIVTVLVTWAEPVAEQVGMDWDAAMVHDHVRPHVALAMAVRVLRFNAGVLVDYPAIEVRAWGDQGYTGFDEQDGVEAAVELCRLHDRAQTTLGLTELRHRLPAPCPRCDTMTLYRDNGEAHVYCARCRISYAEDDYERLTLILADAYKVA